MSAYTIAQLLKCKGKHEIEILVVNNNPGDGSEKYLEPFNDNIRYFEYPSNVIQSHGCGYNFLLEHASHEWVICLESDSYPESNTWLDYYVRLINEGYDCAGSLLQLSGGQYVHPAGMLMRRSVWVEAWKYCKKVQYLYFPNMGRKESFDAHIMVHGSIINEFLKDPDDYIELAENYKPYDLKSAIHKCEFYSAVCGPMHNGMGRLQESVRSYGLRNIDNDAPNVLLDNKAKIVYRVGYEPGQWFSYWQVAMGKKIFHVPTEIKWCNGKIGQQQEYTLMENGLRHCWGISAYKDVDPNDEVAKIKQALPLALYNSLPEHQKIKV